MYNVLILTTENEDDILKPKNVKTFAQLNKIVASSYRIPDVTVFHPFVIRWLHMTCAEIDQDTYNRVQNDDELIFVCESCNQDELSSTNSQVLKIIENLLLLRH